MVYRLGDKVRVSNVTQIFNPGFMSEQDRMGLNICVDADLVRRFIIDRIEGKIVNITKDSRGNLKNLVLLDNGKAVIASERGIEMAKPSYVINAEMNKANLRIGAKIKTTVFRSDVKMNSEGYIIGFYDASLVVRFPNHTNLTNGYNMSNQNDCLIMPIEDVFILHDTIEFNDIAPRFSLQEGDLIKSVYSNNEFQDVITGESFIAENARFVEKEETNSRIYAIIKDSNDRERRIEFNSFELVRPERADETYSLLVGNTMEVGKRLKCSITGATHEYQGITNITMNNAEYIEGTDDAGWYIKWLKTPYRKPRGEREYIRYIAVHPDKVGEYRTHVTATTTACEQYDRKNSELVSFRLFINSYNSKEAYIIRIKNKINRNSRQYAEDAERLEREARQAREREERARVAIQLEAEGIWCHHLRR